MVPPASSRTASLARALWITVGFVAVALGRQLLFPAPRITPREVGGRRLQEEKGKEGAVWA